MKNPSVDRLKSNWVDPQEVRRPKCCCPPFGLTAAVVPGGGREDLISPCGSLEGDGLETSTLTLDVGARGVDCHCPPPSVFLEARLWLFDLSDELGTLSMSVMSWLRTEPGSGKILALFHFLAAFSLNWMLHLKKKNVVKFWYDRV